MGLKKVRMRNVQNPRSTCFERGQLHIRGAHTCEKSIFTQIQVF